MLMVSYQMSGNRSNTVTETTMQKCTVAQARIAQRSVA